MDTPLPRRAPAEAGVDPAAVLRFVDAIDADERTEVHSVMVLRRGAVVAEGWWAPHTPERPRLLYSLSKSFTSAALGFALEEGLVSLDDTLLSHFPELDQHVADGRSRAITLRHLASMASGHDHDMLDDVMEKDPENPVRGFLQLPPEHEPGSHFFYNQLCTYSLGAVLQRVTGQPLSTYLRPRLFDPLAIDDVGWQSWPPGQELGFTGLFARTEDVAKLGLLFLQRGRWGDQQLIPEWYVAEATASLVDSTPGQENTDWRQGYGYQFWQSRHGYRGDGAFGQFCIVLPEYDAVLAMTGGTEAMQAVLDHVWTLLLPGFDDPSADGAASLALEEKLASLALPAPNVAGAAVYAQGGEFDVLPTAKERATSFERVMLLPGDAHSVVLLEPDNALTVALGLREWKVSEPRDRRNAQVNVAASGGWVDEDTFRAEVIFLETPHRLDVALSRAEGKALVEWRGSRPLGGGEIDGLHLP
ncbi:MAG TPA: serine hydrolase domain-containing protein [Nocardioidaceae bacterium]|nr:serine hydrolase domain-containing protein [Nocardioidaceae bacterium]